VTRRLDIGALRDALEGKGEGIPPELAKYADDPCAFARDVLGVELTARQQEALIAVCLHRRVALRSGHRVGKSRIAAVAALWFVCTHPGARVILTAATARQVREILWREVRLLYRQARIPLGGELAETPAGGLRWPDGREVFGLATDQPERFAGLAGAHLLFVCDEASGIAEEIYEALRGNLAGGGRAFLIGNPTRVSGTFYDAFTRGAGVWRGLHISSLESPNVTGEAEVPGLATSEWIDEMRAEYGETSPVYQVRVLGEFPTGAADTVFPLGLVDAAKERWLSAPTSGAAFQSLGPITVGCDPARFGDDETAVVVRRGNVALRPLTFRGQDTVQVASRVLEIIEEHRAKDEKATVRVDVIGIGAGVADQLKRAPHVVVEEINASASPESSTYARTRDELWFTARDWLKAGGCLPPDTRLEAELLAPKYAFTATQKIQVESKDDIKKRLKRSPDRADAFCLAVYELERWRNYAQAVRNLAAIYARLDPVASRRYYGGDAGALERSALAHTKETK
jgi:phage terminase large subunit